MDFQIQFMGALMNLVKCVSREIFRYGLLGLFLILALFLPRIAEAFTATSLGDYGNVTVMEVSGNYDSKIDGQWNYDPRKAIAQEFYQDHGDDYDFLVIFTNYDFVMPELGAKAFYSGVQNQVTGIGVAPYDYSAGYSADGLTPLNRLQGTIDMANIGGYAVDPLDPEFETTLKVLGHEMMHRWGAHLQFVDGVGATSDALLGKDGSHWSYLLDSSGSTLYGNNWQDNGDGTFTSVTPEQAQENDPLGRVLSPLDLYLMGIIDKSQVPPMMLIDNPTIDKTQLPEIGATITGTPVTVTIDDIIAAEGERSPGAADSNKEFRMAFVYAVVPGTWSATDQQALAEVNSIGNVQTEWEKRFSVLTDGYATMEATIEVEEVLATNPGVTDPTLTSHPSPNAADGVSWLIGQQEGGGHWSDQAQTNLLDTAQALSALRDFSTAATAYSDGQVWLSGAVADNIDFLARKVSSSDSPGTSLTDLLTLQNLDGGWGIASGYVSNPADTALALKALAAVNYSGSAVSDAIIYLAAQQHADGGWGVGSGTSFVQPTAYALSALNAYRSGYSVENDITSGLNWLLTKQNPGDGGFGNSPSTVYDTAVAVNALVELGAASSIADNGIDFLLAKQSASGSWNDSVFQTGAAVETLYAGLVAPDLAISAGDIAFTPASLDAVPADVTVSATIHNTGSTAVDQIEVSLYRNDPSLGELIGQKSIAVAGNSTGVVDFVATVPDYGLHPFHFVIDETDQLSEASELNNSASKNLAAVMPPPAVGFDLTTSAGPESQTSVSLSVSLEYPWPEPITVNYSINEASTALPASDYLLDSGVLIFAADESVKSINLTIVNDFIAEIDKSVITDLSNPSEGTLSVSQHIYTIQDDELPEVTISSPQVGLIGVNTTQLLYDTTANNVLVTVDGVLVNKISGDSLGPLSDGAHFVEITATNSLDLSNATRIDFSVDTSIPTIDIISPVGLQTINTPLLNYTVDNAESVEVKIDGVVVGKNTGQYLDPVSEGDHTVTVTAINVLGKSNSVTKSFVVDTTPPEIYLRFPNDGGIISEANPTLLYSLNETGTVVVTVDGVVVATQSGEVLATLADGEHVVQVTLTDTNGVSASDQATFVVSTELEPPYQQVSPAVPGGAVDAFGNRFALRSVSSAPVIEKFDKDGQLLWSRNRWPEISTQKIAGVDADSEGSVYIGFTTWDSVDGFAARGYSDGYIAKFDAEGNWQWSRQIASSYTDYVYDVHVDVNDNIYVTGYLGTNGRNRFVRKYTKDGVSTSFPSYSLGYWDPDMIRVETDINGNVYVGAVYSDKFLISKFSSSGASLGSVTDNMPDSNETISGFGVDAFGNLYVLGQTNGTFPGYTNAGVGADNFIIKYNSQREIVWIHQWGDEFNDFTYGLAVDPDGDLYVRDTFYGFAKFDKDKNLVWSDPTTNSGTIIDSDGKGHIHLSSATYRDQKLPYITANAPALTNQSSLQFNGTVDAGSEISITSDTGAQCGLVNFSDSSTWDCDLSLLEEGKNRATVVAKNGAGFKNWTVAEIVLDTTPPIITPINPLNGQIYTSKPTAQFEINEGTSDAYINGKLVEDISYPLEGLLVGPNELRIEAIDAAGNTSQEVVVFEAQSNAVGDRPFDIVDTYQFGTAAEDLVDQVVKDASGNIYMIGTTYGDLDGEINNGQADVFVRMFDNTGLILWTHLVGTSDSEFGKGIAIDSLGNIHITYEVHYSTVKGNSDDWSDVVVEKYDTSFNLLWSDSIGSNARDYSSAICLDQNTNVYIAGNTEGSINRATYGGGLDYFRAQYDSSGNFVWSLQSGVVGSEMIVDMACNSSGYHMATGQEASGVPLARIFQPSGPLSRSHTYVDLGVGQAVASDEADNFYVTGYLEAATGKDIFVRKYIRSSSQPIFESGWQRSITTSQDDVGQSVGVEANGEIFVAGYTEGSLPDHLNAGGRDVIVSKFGVNGEPRWTSQYGSAGNEEATALVASTTSLFVAGQTDSDFGGISLGGTDVFLLELEPPQGPTLTVNTVDSLTALRNQTLSGVVSAGATISVNVDAPLMSTAVLSPVTISPDGTWYFTVSSMAENTDNVLTITATDVDGSSSEAVTIFVDTLVPGLSIDPVLSPTVLPSQTITGSVELGASLSIEINGQSSEALVPVNGAWSYSVSGMVEGGNVIIFTAIDYVGNESTETVTIKYNPPLPIALLVAPNSILDSDKIALTVNVGSILPTGDEVNVDILIDANQNGVVDSGERVIRNLKLTDGVVSTNSNVPGDEDGLADGAITSTLNYFNQHDLYHTAGIYLFRVTGSSSAAVVPFQVLASSELQTVSGSVLAGGSPVAGAIVSLKDKWQRTYRYAITDVNGQYLFNVKQPGEYYLLAQAEGYVVDKTMSGPVLLTAAEAKTGVDFDLTSGNWQVTGQVVDSTDGSGIASIPVYAESSQYLSVSWTDGSGNYQLNLPDGDYDLYLAGSPMVAGAGQLGYALPALQLTVSGDMPGQNISLPSSLVTVCGAVTESTLPVAGMVVQGSLAIGSNPQTQAVTDAAGNYCLGLSAGETWQIGQPSSTAQVRGLLTGGIANISASVGPFTNNDLSAQTINAWLNGFVHDSSAVALENILVQAVDSSGQVEAKVLTATDGSYRLGVFDDTWKVDALVEAQGFEPLAAQFVAVASGETSTVDFTAQLPTLELTIDPVVTPTEIDSQTLTGTTTEGATISITVDTSAVVGSVTYPSTTTWECVISSLAEGVNNITVNADDGSQAVPKQTAITYNYVQSNSIVVQKAQYWGNKNTLTVEATSDLAAAANLSVDGWGALDWDSKKSEWSKVFSNVSSAPASITVTGSEGSVTMTVSVR